MNMQLTNYRGVMAAAVLGVGLTGSASALSLNTTALQATSTLQFSSDAFNAASLARISFSALGNAYEKGSVTYSDGIKVPTFVLPVTSADVSLGWSLKLSPNSGEASGAGLLLTRGNRQLGLANFTIDYATDRVYADVLANGVSTNMAVYSFVEQSDLNIGLKGLSLTMNQTLGSLKLTTQAADTFASVLGLSDVLKHTMAGLDYGTIAINITTALRSPVSDKALTAAVMVPEPSTYALMALGMIGIATIARRKQAA